MQDPWQKMAIQEQFSQQVENQEVGYPATLAYLEQTMEQRWSELDQSDRGGLGYEIDRLLDALMAGTFATTLTTKVWGPEPKVVENQKETLSSPEELVNLIVSQSDLNLY